VVLFSDGKLIKQQDFTFIAKARNAMQGRIIKGRRIL
jgi:hypothetical protein